MKKRVSIERSFRASLLAVVVLLWAAVPTPLHADTITIGGIINQSTQDGTGPATSNAGLNSIMDGDDFSVSLNFARSISSAGTFDLTGSKVLFSVPAANATEDSFDAISLTVANSGTSAQFSLLACLAGAACNQGNELDLNFTIPFANLNSLNVTAQGIPNLLPLDLLEDDGITDIHGSIGTYSYAPPSAVPEPSELAMLVSGAVTLVLRFASNAGNGGLC